MFFIPVYYIITIIDQGSPKIGLPHKVASIVRLIMIASISQALAPSGRSRAHRPVLHSPCVATFCPCIPVLDLTPIPVDNIIPKPVTLIPRAKLRWYPLPIVSIVTRFVKFPGVHSICVSLPWLFAYLYFVHTHWGRLCRTRGECSSILWGKRFSPKRGECLG